MISFEEAFSLVQHNTQDFGVVALPLDKANGRILAETIYTDRDFPAFNRATKDGIALNYQAIVKGISKFKIESIAAAGSPQKELKVPSNCIEVMTGAMVPKKTDTVVMYEHLDIANGYASLKKDVVIGQNIHVQGSDEPEATKVLEPGTRIEAAEIGVLASVGKAMVLVKKNPKVSIVSTGDELVDITETPKPYQIRKSNAYTLSSALLNLGIASNLVHIADDKNKTENVLQRLVEENDIILLSGGVSKGKYDYLPETFDKLGVTKVFHRVKQRPGKPFWFGKHEAMKTMIFAFPGNPASTFANFHVYLIPWINKCFGIETKEISAILEEPFDNQTDLTRFIRAKASLIDGALKVYLIHGNGSGDLTSLTKSNGFIRLKPHSTYGIGQKVPFVCSRKVV